MAGGSWGALRGHAQGRGLLSGLSPGFAVTLTQGVVVASRTKSCATGKVAAYVLKSASLETSVFPPALGAGPPTHTHNPGQHACRCLLCTTSGQLAHRCRVQRGTPQPGPQNGLGRASRQLGGALVHVPLQRQPALPGPRTAQPCWLLVNTLGPPSALSPRPQQMGGGCEGERRAG